MALTFTDTYNMIAYLTKSDASEGFDQIIDFLNASSIKYALTINPNIYVLSIKQFWSSVSVKKVNGVTRLQALVDKKKVIITEATIREALRLGDAESIDCLPNEEIFTELSRMGYEKPSTKITFYKAFFLPQWKFLIHTILQCMTAKRMSWNEFSSFMASAVICLSIGRKFNFSVYIFDSLVRNVDSSTKFNMVGNGFFRVDTPLFEGMIVAQQDDDVVDEGVASVAIDDVPAAVDEPSIPSHPPTTQPPPPSQELPSTSQGRQAESQAQIYQIDLKHADKVLSMQDDELEPSKLKKVVEVVTTAKLMTYVVTAAAATITVDDTPIIAVTLTTAPSAARRRKGVVIRDPEETAAPSIIIHSEPNSKDKGKGIMDKVIEQVQRKEKEDNDVMRYQALKRKLQTEAQARKNMMIYLRNMAVFKMDYFKGMSYDDIHSIFEKKINSNATPLARKVPVVDYEIVSENNKPYYRIMRADESHQLFLSFLSLLWNFDREDLEVLWQLVKERFASSKPKNFSDDFLLTTVTYMFKKPDVQA
nr:hypothetical protein [Tanacetum cinerariifolium]